MNFIESGKLRGPKMQRRWYYPKKCSTPSSRVSVQSHKRPFLKLINKTHPDKHIPAYQPKAPCSKSAFHI